VQLERDIKQVRGAIDMQINSSDVRRQLNVNLLCKFPHLSQQLSIGIGEQTSAAANTLKMVLSVRDVYLFQCYIV
jgi:hypothetical protein